MHSPCVHNPQYCLGAYVRRRCIRDNGPSCTGSPPQPADGKRAACIPQEVGEKAVCLHELPLSERTCGWQDSSPTAQFGLRHNRATQAQWPVAPATRRVPASASRNPHCKRKAPVPHCPERHTISAAKPCPAPCGGRKPGLCSSLRYWQAQGLNPD